MKISLGKIENASQPAVVMYGMHMEPGTAEYIDREGNPYKIFINEETIRKMNSSFRGKPVYVDHVDKVDLSKVEREAAGWVVESFYNKYDGKTWCKFLVFSDAGHEAIRRGFKLSNAYIPTSMGMGGRWHGMDYKKEVLDAEYEHLALVQNPRYEASVVFTEDQFQAYNKEREAEITKYANSQKKGVNMKFNLFKKEKVENSADLKELSVSISGKEMKLENALELAEKYVNMAGYAAEEHMVKVNDEEMSVKELKDCYGKMKSEMDDLKKKNSEADEEKKKNEAAAEEEKKKNEEAEAEKKKNEEKAKEEEAKKNALQNSDDVKHFETLRNAANAHDEEKRSEVLLNKDRVDLGKKLF